MRRGALTRGLTAGRVSTGGGRRGGRGGGGGDSRAHRRDARVRVFHGPGRRRRLTGAPQGKLKRGEAEGGAGTDQRALRAYFEALQADLLGRLGRAVRDATVLDEGPAPHRVEPHYGCGSRPPTGLRAASKVGPGHDADDGGAGDGGAGEDGVHEGDNGAGA